MQVWPVSLDSLLYFFLDSYENKSSKPLKGHDGLSNVKDSTGNNGDENAVADGV